MPAISNKNPRASRVSSNWVKTKLDFIKDYKFTIAFENEIKNGWVTEKLTHPLLTNSIPIYVGTEKVARDFNTKCFINYADFKNMEEFMAHIIRVDKDDTLYKKYLEQPIFKDKKQYNFSTKTSVEKKLYKIIDKENEKHN